MTTPTPEERVATIRARLDADRTPGDWELRWQCPISKKTDKPIKGHDHDIDEGWIANADGATVACLNERYTSASIDGALIANAPQDLAFLLALVASLRAENAALRSALYEHLGCVGECHIHDVPAPSLLHEGAQPA